MNENTKLLSNKQTNKRLFSLYWTFAFERDDAVTCEPLMFTPLQGKLI